MCYPLIEPSIFRITLFFSHTLEDPSFKLHLAGATSVWNDPSWIHLILALPPAEFTSLHLTPPEVNSLYLIPS